MLSKERSIYIHSPEEKTVSAFLRKRGHCPFASYASSLLYSQNSKTIVSELSRIHLATTNDSAAAISHRAMNVFMAGKTAYLSAPADLSYYTNYVTLSSDEGRITVNHNFQATAGIDEPIRGLFSAGFDMHVASSYAKSFVDYRYENELGLSVDYKWIGKTTTRFTGPQEKMQMNVLRAGLLQDLTASIREKEMNFENSLLLLNEHTAGSHSIDTARSLLRKKFQQDLQKEYEEKFAYGQADLLNQTRDCKIIRLHWTSIRAYIPLAFPAYRLAPSLTANLVDRHPYPFSVMVGHTRLWESSASGRLFISINGQLLLNNSKLSYRLNKISYTEYIGLGGSDSAHAAERKYDRLYTGNYQTFVTPSIMARAVYFPTSSHVGISILAEQHFGDYKTLDAKLSIPVVLINSRQTPGVNIECYLLLFDISHTSNEEGQHGRTSLGISAGIPLSRLMY